MQNKNETDHDIAQDQIHQEDSYTEQIASLEIDNTKISLKDGRESGMNGQEMTQPDDYQTQVEASGEVANDSDEEFR